jgi:Protein of unknown function (DUF3017)
VTSEGADPPVVTQPAPSRAAPPRPPRHRFDPLAPVVLTVAVGVVIAAMHHPRSGMFVVCAGLALGALLRLVLSPRNAGSLVVRKRRVDFVILAGLAVALGVLAAVTPFPTGSG